MDTPQVITLNPKSIAVQFHDWWMMRNRPTIRPITVGVWLSYNYANSTYDAVLIQSIFEEFQLMAQRTVDNLITDNLITR